MARFQSSVGKTLEQLKDLSLPQRLVILLGALLVAGALLWMVQWAARPEMTPLLEQDLSPEDLAQVRAGLELIREPYKIVGSRVLVNASANRQHILAALQQNEHLPMDTSLGFAALVKEANPWISQEENQRRWTVALARELERVLGQFAGVQRAHVFLDLNTRPRGFTRQPADSSASVTLIMKGGQPVARPLALAAAKLVAGAVRGLSLKSVEVVDGGGRPALDWQDEEDGSASLLHRLQKQNERDIAAKIKSQLDFDPRLRVNVQVVLDYSSSRVQDSKPSDPVELERSTMTEKTVRSRSSGQPGVQPNVGVAAGGGGQEETTDRESSEVRNQPGMTVSVQDTPGGETKQVFAAVNLSYSYLLSVYKRTNADGQPPTEAQIQEVFDRQKARIVSQVAKLVMPPIADQVAVDWYYDAPDEPAAASQTSSLDTSLEVARKYGPASALTLLAGFSLFLLMRMARRSGLDESIGADLGLPAEAIEAARRSAAGARASEGAAGSPFAAGEAEDVLEAPEVDQQTLQMGKMVEQVSRMIDSDAESAATLLESWVGEGR